VSFDYAFFGWVLQFNKRAKTEFAESILAYETRIPALTSGAGKCHLTPHVIYM